MQSDQLAGENSQKHAELKVKEEEVTGLKGEISRLSRLREKVARNLRSVEEQKSEVEGHREKLKQEITAMERGIVMVVRLLIPIALFLQRWRLNKRKLNWTRRHLMIWSERGTFLIRYQGCEHTCTRSCFKSVFATGHAKG